MWRKLDFFFKWNFLAVINVKISPQTLWNAQAHQHKGLVFFFLLKESRQIQEAPVIMSNCISVVFVFEMSQYYLSPQTDVPMLKIQINGCCKKEKNRVSLRISDLTAALTHL